MGIFVGYTRVNHHYRVFLLGNRRTIVSADVFLPLAIPEGVSSPSYDTNIPIPTSENAPFPLSSPLPSTTHVSVPPPRPNLQWDNQWLDWAEENPEVANDWYRKGNPILRRLVEERKHVRSEPTSVETESHDSPDDQPTTPDGSPSRPSPLRIDEVPTTPDGSPPRRSVDSYRDTNEGLRTVAQRTIEQSNPPSQHAPGQNQLRVRRSGRVVRPPRYYGDFYLPSVRERPTHDEDEELPTTETALLSVLTVEEPKTYRQAITSPRKKAWENAMNEELKSLEENNVFTIVERPRNRKVVGGKWVFKAKGDANGNLEKFKARYVAQGYSQTQGLDFDEIFAPVARYDSLRLLLALSASENWKPRQLDVKSAFLYGLLKEEVYMELPEGSKKDGHVAKLNRCIYGLKQSPREWYFRLVEFLRPNGFQVSSFDPCILVHASGGLFIAIYVDDSSLFGPSDELMGEIISLLKSEFKINDMGHLHWLLGIQIEYPDSGIVLSQRAFIDKILTRFSMQDCNPVLTPVDPNQQLQKSQDAETRASATTYQQIIGSMMYLVMVRGPIWHIQLHSYRNLVPIRPLCTFKLPNAFCAICKEQRVSVFTIVMLHHLP